MIVRRIVHGMGYRYRLHAKDLPGRPDLVFRKAKKVIFVHGCFWHQHRACREGRIPGSRQEYWTPKLTRNVERDAEHTAALKQNGWSQLIVWECEMRDDPSLHKRLQEFLES
jgi:DNA mismatch endonuclease (patch repair protein)